MTSAVLCLLASAARLSSLPVDSATINPALAPREIRAVRLTQPVTVDGLLAESIWQSAERIWHFVQRDPNEGAQPSESTVVLIAYDEAAIYVGARMYDAHPDSIVARLSRRDVSTNSDRFSVYLDPYHDRRSGFYFALNAAGTLSDGILFNDDWDDDTWDGVWEGKVHVDSLGWTAEFRIPYSQLRFRQTAQYVWGVNFSRDIARKNERDCVVCTPKNGSGFVSRFVDLVGIAGIVPPRHVEVLPYVTSRAEYTHPAAGNPFNDGSKYVPRVGADVKLGLGPNLTLNATVNPDFGQVEVDPAVVNLSDVETFFEEKRPFFIEGSSIFTFGRGGANNYWGFNWAEPDFFYSRRIGRPPQGDVPPADYNDVPAGAHILGALKLTGKAGSSWNIGTLHAVTAREMAQLDTAGVRFDKEVEPLSYYGLFRVQKEFPDGRRGLGMLSTVTAREFADGRLRDALNSHSVGLGIDGWTFLDPGKTWVVTGWVGASQIRGDDIRMTAVQQNSQHYFQRPDARNVRVDSAATSLTGWAGRVYLNKQKGNTFFNSALGVISPEFDVNDMGFQFRTDVINMHAGGGYRWTKPGRFARYGEILGAAFRNYDFDGDVTWTGLFGNGYVQFNNYYSVYLTFAYNPQTVNDRRTRGGPLTLNRPGYQANVGGNSDGRKAWIFGLNTGTYQAEQDRSWYVNASVEWRPAPNVSLRVSPGLDGEKTPVQYVGTYADPLASATFGQRYVFADLAQTSLSAGIRLNWTFTPRLSLQLYAQPLIAAGDYNNFKELARPRSFEFNTYGRGASTFDSTTYVADPDGAGPAPPIQLYNPDFNFKSLRGNAVLRWEYLPGSTLYLVWTQTRSDYQNIGEFQLDRSLGRLLAAKADNILMVKLTYWWNP